MPLILKFLSLHVKMILPFLQETWILENYWQLIMEANQVLYSYEYLIQELNHVVSMY